MLARLFKVMSLDPNQKHLLRFVCTNVGVLASRILSGPDLGSVVTLAMILDVLLEADADETIMTKVKGEFSSLEMVPTSDTTLLFSILFRVCDLSVKFNREKADHVVASLISLDPTSVTN